MAMAPADLGADSLFVYPNPAGLIGLAKRARFHGFRLETDQTGAHFVVEPATGRREFVTAVSCTCRQFIQSGSAGCQHLALLQVEHGWLPEAVVEVGMEAVR